MYLKRIDIQGFKSFANKMDLQFNKGITGIVGPNGSGKSNVADAVRWVLGEQSAKQLRGSKMEDVIFAGTENRKPIGFAQVAITIDNSDKMLPIDYTEVTIARKVYRSGESEYSINGSACRLKDVQELFFDTGIGREGYSIIGQGQVDHIVNSKPDDRRELFDEAAGIVKYKRRKGIAEKKLDESKLNLERVTDIINEIETQVGPLKEQSEVAKVFLVYRDELKDNEVNIFIQEYDKVKEQLSSLEQKTEQAKEQLVVAEAEYANAREQHEMLQTENEQLEQQLNDIRASFSNDQLENEKAEGNIKVLKEKITSLEAVNEQNKIRVQNLLKDIEQKDEERDGFKNEKQGIDVKLDNLLVKQDDIEADLEEIIEKVKNKEREISTQQSNIIDYLNKKSEVASKKQKLETVREQGAIKKTELMQKLLKNRSEQEQYTLQKKALQEEQNNIDKKLEDIKEYKNLSFEELKRTDNSLREANEKLSVTQQQYHQVKSTMEAKLAVAESYDGYSGAIKKIMEQKTTNKGLVGVVADIIKVKKEYETAIEIALGGSIQNIVTDNEDTAKLMIEKLKREKLGRATFLPLTSVGNKQSNVNESVLKEQGVIGFASSLAECEDRFRRLVDSLIGRVVVVKTVENAIVLQKKYNQSLRIVTLEGELLSPGGAMTGGNSKHNSNLLGRKREIEELEERLQQLIINKTDIEKNIEKLKADREGIENRIRKANDEQQQAALDKNTITMNIHQLEEKINTTARDRESFDTELKDIEGQVNKLDTDEHSVQGKLDELENEKTIAENAIKNITELVFKEKENEKLISDRLNKLKIEITMLETKDSHIIENIKRLSKEKERITQEINEINEATKNNVVDIREKQAAVEEIVNKVNNSKSDLEYTKKRIEELTHQREAKSEILKELYEKRDELSKRQSDLDKEVFRLASSAEKQTEQHEQLVNYMWEEYGLTYSTSLEHKKDNMPTVIGMKRRVTELKQLIRDLGDVNVNSIADYKNLTERYELMSVQRDDLIQAQANLEGIIVELDEAMRKQFAEKFKEIQQQFEIVFRELFGGGKASLELVEGEDILEAGIKIIAQPPGKKLQNMVLLSGGEKAFTAIALLFAIQRLKPSPFCLLDEIEAALDDANVIKFAKYLHKLTGNTQFIVITHRKGTMELADALYGITMQEKGISTLVSVKLIENELEDKQNKG